jgi:FtsP/CotA-like multicopper oxidase with cupredoxin domain
VLDGSVPPKMTSILLNGLGSYAGGTMPGLKYNITFEKGKKYLMRLINTSVDTTFIFAIDHHNITVMSSDFVPIKPYVTDHVVVGIGR